MIHPTYGGPRLDLQPLACPCCSHGSVEPTFRLCDPCHAKAIRLMVCHHAAPKEKR